MGMTDLETHLSDNQAPGNVGTTVSTHGYDTGVAGTMPRAFQAPGTAIHDVGGGRELIVDIRVVTTFDSAEEDATCNFQLCAADDAAGTNAVVLSETGVLAEAVLVAGYRARLRAFPPAPGHKRVIIVRAVVATHNFTTGGFDADLVLDSTNVQA